MIDLKREIERELSLIDRPDLWDRIQAEAANHADANVVDLTTARHRRGTSWWLAVAAVTVLVALVAAWARLDDHQGVDTTPATDVPRVPEPTTIAGPPTVLARGRVELVAYGGPGLELPLGQTLDVDAVERDGVVTGELRVNDLVVTLQCTDPNRRDGEIRLGGEVTQDPEGQGLVPDDPDDPANRDLAVIGDGDVAMGDRVALIIREGSPVRGADRVGFFADDGAGSCTELLGLIRNYHDDGELNHLREGADIETGEGPWNP